MLNSTFPANRLKALLWIHHHASGDMAMDTAMCFWEDKSCVVRGQACTMLESRCPDFNTHAYYAERLTKTPTADLSIVRVLGTVGSKWDRLAYLWRVLILRETGTYD